MNACLFDIQRNSFVDGPGIRTTVFFKGCNLRCAWCHNPESQSVKPQMMLYEDLCIGCEKCKEVCAEETCSLCGKCTFYCPTNARKVCGKEYSVDEVFCEIIKDKAYFDHSGGGVTFSGGECMLQIDFLEKILKKCKENGIHTAVDTAGHIPFKHFKRILPHTDCFLYDIKLFSNEKHKKYVGVENTLILSNLKKLLSTNICVWVRIPIIAGINDSEQELLQIKTFLEKYGRPERIDLLPYHAMGEHKYTALRLPSPSFSAPTKEKINQLKALF